MDVLATVLRVYRVERGTSSALVSIAGTGINSGYATAHGIGWSDYTNLTYQ